MLTIRLLLVVFTVFVPLGLALIFYSRTYSNCTFPISKESSLHENTTIFSNDRNQTATTKTKYEVCSSISEYDIDVPGTTRVFFKDRKSAFISNAGKINGVDADGGLWWYNRDFPRWEYVTFIIFRALIKPDMVYVGFGEWIGPTILYSSQLAEASYGFEPDITAFRSLALNARANQCFGDRLKIYSLCIYMNFGDFVLKDALGGSGASIIDKDAPITKLVNPTANVQCVTLEYILKNHSLLDERLFFKVDTEGAEALLVPNLVPMIKKLKHKPVWFLSKHQNFRYAEPQVQQGFRDLIALYKCHRFTPASHQTFLTDSEILKFRVSNLTTIDNHTISNTESNPDLILVDEECTVVDRWIQDIVHFFV